MSVIVCTIGCCPGCQNCYGMSIGCHQVPCRCELPCVCDYKKEDEDVNWRNGCERHNDAKDERFLAERADEGEPPDDESMMPAAAPCPECNEVGPCGYDAEMRPWIHLVKEDES